MISKFHFIASLLPLVVLVIVALTTSPRIVINAQAIINKTVYMTPTGQYQTVDASSQVSPTTGIVLANIYINHTVNITGWDTVVVTADAAALKSNFTNAYYGAGFGEGFWTWEQILCNNYSTQGPPLAGGAGKWMEENINFFAGYQTTIAPSHPEIAQAVAGLYHLLIGMRDGVNAAIDAAGSSAKKWTLYDIYALNMQAELSDVQIAGPAQFPQFEDPARPSEMNLNGQSFVPLEKSRMLRARLGNGDVEKGFQRRGYGSHCSALVRVTSDDYYYAHDTWSAYSSLAPRQFKTYAFENSVTMSSYAGFCSSVDDFYETSNGLGVMETTIDQYNATLTQVYVVPQTLPTFIRAMVANYWAQDGWEWTRLFLTLNSGTYCNEWMISNMKLINSANLHNLSDATLLVLDQLPGPFSAIRDFTYLLNSQGFFPSYNIPAIESVYIMSGNQQAYEQYGNFFSYTKYARAEMFARDAPGVKTLQDVQTIMRWNRWETDPLSSLAAQSNCVGCDPVNNPQLVIANRADLVPVNASFGNLSAMVSGFYRGAAFGAIDTKISSYKMFDLVGKTFGASIIAGPSTSNGVLPVFDWTTCPVEYAASTRHRGQVNRFDFGFQAVAAYMPRSGAVPVAPPTPTPEIPSVMTLESFKLIDLESSITSVVFDSSNSDVAYIGTGNAVRRGIYKVYLSDFTLSSMLPIEGPLDFSYSVAQPGTTTVWFVGSPALYAQQVSFAATVYEIDVSEITPTVKSTHSVPNANGGDVVPAAYFDFDGGFEYYSVGQNCFISSYWMKGKYAVNGLDVGSEYTSQACIALNMMTTTTPDSSTTSKPIKYLFALPACYGFGGAETPGSCNLLRVTIGNDEIFYESHIAAAVGLPPNFGSASMAIVNNLVLIVGGRNFVKINGLSLEILGVMSSVNSLNGPIALDNSGFFAYVGTICGTSSLSKNATIVRVNLLDDTPVLDSVYSTRPLPNGPVAFTSAITSPTTDAKGNVRVYFFSGPVANTGTLSIVNSTAYKFSVPSTTLPPSTTPNPTSIYTQKYFELDFQLYKNGVNSWPTKELIVTLLQRFLWNNNIANSQQIYTKILLNNSATHNTNNNNNNNLALPQGSVVVTTFTIYFELMVYDSSFSSSLVQAVSLLATTSPSTVAGAFSAVSFEVFVQSSTTTTTSPTFAPGSNNDNTNNGSSTGSHDKDAKIAGGVAGGVVVVAILVAIIYFVTKKKTSAAGDTSGTSSVRGELIAAGDLHASAQYTSADV